MKTLRRLRAQPVLRRADRDPDHAAAGDAARQRADRDHAREHQRADRRGLAAVRAAAPLDHRVRLPDEPARPGVRRLLGEPGALPDAGVRDRPQEPAHRHDALVPAPGRARSRRLAVRAHDRGRPAEAGVRGVPAAAAADGDALSARAARGRARRRRRSGARPRSAAARARGRPRPSARAAPGRRRAGRARRRAPPASPGSTRKPSTPSSTTSGTPPTRVATTGQPLASASIAVTGVPSFAEGSTNASNAA